MNLNSLYKIRLSNKVALRIIAVSSLVGFADALYLTANHYLGDGVRCFITSGCEKVLTSQYSSFFGIPISVFGLAFYALVFVLVNLLDIYGKDLVAKALVGLTFSGFFSSVVLLCLQLFVIRAICFYCIVSLISSTVIFILAIIIKVEINKQLTNKYE